MWLLHVCVIWGLCPFWPCPSPSDFGILVSVSCTPNWPVVRTFFLFTCGRMPEDATPCRGAQAWHSVSRSSVSTPSSWESHTGLQPSAVDYVIEVSSASSLRPFLFLGPFNILPSTSDIRKLRASFSIRSSSVSCHVFPRILLFQRGQQSASLPYLYVL